MHGKNTSVMNRGLLVALPKAPHRTSATFVLAETAANIDATAGRLLELHLP